MTLPLAVLLPIAGAVLAEALRLLLTRATENLNPAIAALRTLYPLIDAALLQAPTDLRDRLGANPVAAIATELLSDQGDAITVDQIGAAATWASRQFDFTIHEKIDLEQITPAQRALAWVIVGRLSDRFL
jgi:hypothetical protein